MQHRVGSLHCFDGNTGPFANRHALTHVDTRKDRRQPAAVTDISFFVLVRLAVRQDACGGEERFEQSGGIYEFDALFAQNALYAANERGRVLFAKRSEQLEQTPVRLHGGEDTDMLDLAGHHDFGDAFILQNLNQLAELADVDPVQRSGQAGNLGRSLVLDRYDNHIVALALSRLEGKQWETAVSGDHSIAMSGESSHSGPT